MKFIQTHKNLIIKLQMFFLFFFTLFYSPTSAATSLGTNLGNKTLQQLVADFVLVISQYVITILVGLTLFTFLYGLMKYIYKGQGSDTARAEGRKLMLWGIIGIFVITSVWGLVAIVASFFGQDTIGIPKF